MPSARLHMKHLKSIRACIFHVGILSHQQFFFTRYLLLCYSPVLCVLAIDISLVHAFTLASEQDNIFQPLEAGTNDEVLLSSLTDSKGLSFLDSATSSSSLWQCSEADLNPIPAPNDELNNDATGSLLFSSDAGSLFPSTDVGDLGGGLFANSDTGDSCLSYEEDEGELQAMGR